MDELAPAAGGPNSKTSTYFGPLFIITFNFLAKCSN